MTKIITETESRELWEAALQSGNVTKYTKELERVSTWKTPYSDQYLRVIPLRPGFSIEIYIYDSKHSHEIGWEFRHSESLPLTFAFMLSGGLGELTDGIHNDYYYVRTGQSYALSVAGTEEIQKFSAGQRVQIVCIRVTPDFLRTLSHGQEDSLPAALKILIESDVVPLLYQPAGKMTPEMKTALRDILQCPHQGVTKRIYLEAKALELIALQFTQLLEQQSVNHAASNLKLADINRLHQAKDILQRNIDNPPSLMKLAQQVGLNDYKLKAGFRQVFKTTVFGYLRDYRMRQAEQLLQETQMSVTEIAYAIGYACPTSFSTAFLKKFGVNPSFYRK